MNKTYIILIAMLLFFVSGCGIALEETISVDEAYQLILDNKSNSNFIILDVRTPSEFNDGHVENALNIDFYRSDFTAELEKLDKSKTYLVYCRSGSRSLKSVKKMKEINFKSLYNMSC